MIIQKAILGRVIIQSYIRQQTKIYIYSIEIYVNQVKSFESVDLLCDVDITRSPYLRILFNIF